MKGKPLFHIPEVCATNVHIPEVCATNVHIPEVCATNVHIPEVCATNVHIPEVCATNVHIPEVCATNAELHCDTIQTDPARIPDRVDRGRGGDFRGGSLAVSHRIPGRLFPACR